MVLLWKGRAHHGTILKSSSGGFFPIRYASALVSVPPLAYLTTSQMRKIGTTTAGNLIVEMTKGEYEALLLLRKPRESVSAIEKQVSATGMSHAEMATYVADRLRKLSPKKRDGVIRSMEAMFQFNGGIAPAEVEKLLATLQKRKFFAIASDGKVTYLGT